VAVISKSFLPIMANPTVAVQTNMVNLVLKQIETTMMILVKKKKKKMEMPMISLIRAFRIESKILKKGKTEIIPIQFLLRVKLNI